MSVANPIPDNPIPWGSPTQEMLSAQTPYIPQSRSVADQTYLAPGLLPFRQTDSEPFPTQESGAPEAERPLLRRFLGAATLEAQEALQALDALPLLVSPGYTVTGDTTAQDNLMRRALAIAGVRVPDDTPSQALKNLHVVLPLLRPFGRPETFLLAFEACLGATGRRYAEDHNWRHAQARAGKASVTVSSVLYDLDPFDPLISPAAVFITVRNVPPYVIGVLKAVRCGAFTTPIVERGQEQVLLNLPLEAPHANP